MLSPIIIAAHRERAKIIIVQQSTKREREENRLQRAPSVSCFGTRPTRERESSLSLLLHLHGMLREHARERVAAFLSNNEPMLIFGQTPRLITV